MAEFYGPGTYLRNGERVVLKEGWRVMWDNQRGYFLFFTNIGTQVYFNTTEGKLSRKFRFKRELRVADLDESPEMNPGLFTLNDVARFFNLEVVVVESRGPVGNKIYEFRKSGNAS